MFVVSMFSCLLWACFHVCCVACFHVCCEHVFMLLCSMFSCLLCSMFSCLLCSMFSCLLWACFHVCCVACLLCSIYCVLLYIIFHVVSSPGRWRATETIKTTIATHNQRHYYEAGVCPDPALSDKGEEDWHREWPWPELREAYQHHNIATDTR